MLSIYSRSPSAYHAVRSLSILQLPCDKTLKGYTCKHSSSPGINYAALFENAARYKVFQQDKVQEGLNRPVAAKGVLIWDEARYFNV